MCSGDRNSQRKIKTTTIVPCLAPELGRVVIWRQRNIEVKSQSFFRQLVQSSLHEKDLAPSHP